MYLIKYEITGIECKKIIDDKNELKIFLNSVYGINGVANLTKIKSVEDVKLELVIYDEKRKNYYNCLCVTYKSYLDLLEFLDNFNYFKIIEEKFKRRKENESQ